MVRRGMRPIAWLVVVAACGTPVLPGKDVPRPSVSAAPEPVDPWDAQAVALSGIELDTGACVVATGWPEAEAWAKAFRLPRDKAPGKGAEVPQVTFARIELPASAVEPSARLYRQRSQYTAAGEDVVRRFLMVETAEARVTGCAVYEAVVRPGVADATEQGRIAALAPGHFELTTRDQGDEHGRARFLPSLDGMDLSFRHACTVVDGMMACLSLPGGAHLTVRGASWRYEPLMALGGRHGPFLFPVTRGVTATVGEPGVGRAAPIVGRALATGIRRKERVATLPQSRVDMAGLPPITDRGVCMTTEVASAPQPADELDIDAPALYLWAESFQPESSQGASAHVLGELAPGYAVEAFTVGGFSGPAHTAFAFASEPQRITGCAVYAGKKAMFPVSESYQRVGERAFSYRIGGAGGALTLADEERFVLCAVNDHEGMGCATASVKWRSARTSLTEGGLIEGGGTEEARIAADALGFTWSSSADTRRVTVRFGTTTELPTPASDGSVAPQRLLDAKATLHGAP
jgi:hypothetical protein